MVAAAPHVSQRLLLVLAEIDGDKGWYLETARTDLSGGIDHPVSFGLRAATPEQDGAFPTGTQHRRRISSP